MGYPRVITIDGPAASGKSTLGELLARRLGYVFFDTGVLYRALTLLALQRNVSLDDPAALAALARVVDLAILPPTVEDGRQYTVLGDGADITWGLRNVAVDRSVSRVAGYPEVRAALRQRQREIGQRGQVVMVGRDIGSVVMPDADYKIYLDAPLHERARRRHTELLRRGAELPLDTVTEDLQRRDALDERNTFVPAGAVILRNEGVTPDEEVARIMSSWQQDQTQGAASPSRSDSSHPLS
jgi:cytidylate kinase